MTDSPDAPVGHTVLQADARIARLVEDDVRNEAREHIQIRPISGQKPTVDDDLANQEFRKGVPELKRIDDEMRRPGSGCAALKIINNDHVDMGAKEGLLHSATATRVKLDCAPKP